MTDDSVFLVQIYYWSVIIIDGVKPRDFFQLHGFTCGVDDLLLLPEKDKLRSKILSGSEVRSNEVHWKFTGADEDHKGLWNVIA